MGLVMKKVSLDRFFLEYFCFHLSVSFNHCARLVFHLSVANAT